ncbi:MAG: DUF4910 domain-containing protein [Acidobacteriia bacterium]|nr:DUF4910 domain-containing protein [Terriglobia bacterium]
MIKKISVLLMVLACRGVFAQSQSLLPERQMQSIIQETSGASAKRNLQTITTFNRIRGSRDFHAAAQFVESKVREAGLTDVHIEQFPADGKRFYGTLKARQAWDAESAELWEVRPSGNFLKRPTSGSDPGMMRVRRLCSWEQMRVCLAEDSESAEVVAELVDVGQGTSEKDYEGKEVRGKIALISSQGGAAQHLAVDRFGALGMVSSARNQPQGWSQDNDALVRWGHLDSYSATKTFAFQISPKQAQDLRERLAHGDKIWLYAEAKAGRHDGSYEVVTGTIPGRDEVLKNEEIVFSCHLDHEMPGANDNASGCAAILEVARVMNKLVADHLLPPPRRTLRFVWPPEIEGTQIFLSAHPDLLSKMKAAIHLDMVGGSQDKTKAIFHVTRTPDSIPSFINDVAQDFAEYIRDLSVQYASTGDARFAVFSNEGTREALNLEVSDFTSGSDHQIYDEGSYRIPSIYLNDWPDRFIHTNQDSIEQIDATKLKGAVIVAAASGYFLANLDASNSAEVTSEIIAHAKRRMADSQGRFSDQAKMAAQLDLKSSFQEMDNFTRYLVRRERATLISLRSFIGDEQVSRLDLSSFTHNLSIWAGINEDEIDNFMNQLDGTASEGEVPVRSGPPGPMSVFGYSFLADRFGAEKTSALKLFSRFSELQKDIAPFRRAGADDYAYEMLNAVNGKRTVQEIRDFVSAEFGPIPLEWVREYLKALGDIGAVQWKKP